MNIQTAVIVQHLDVIAAKARKVAEGEDTTMEGWLEYGAALLEGRSQFPKGDNARFHEWKVASLGNLPEAKEEQAAMWAAANPQVRRDKQDEIPRQTGCDVAAGMCRREGVARPEAHARRFALFWGL